MNYSEYPGLAGRTEGNYAYLRHIWTFGLCEAWQPADGEAPLSCAKLKQMRLQHGIIGLNTEAAEVCDLIAKPIEGEASQAEYCLEVAKELGDVMWYTTLLFHFNNGNDSPQLADRFSRVCTSAQRIADEASRKDNASEIRSVVWAYELDRLANMLLKRLKNQMFYGTIPEEDQLVEWLTGIVLRVTQIGHQHGYTLQQILELNIDKLKRKFPNGFNGVDAETKRHENSPQGDRVTEAETRGLAYPRPLGPVTPLLPSSEYADRKRFEAFLAECAATVATWPAWKQNLLGQHVRNAVSKPDAITTIQYEDMAPPPAVPQSDLTARIKDLAAFDVHILELAVAVIKEIHESENPQHLVDLHSGVLKNMSSAVERLGWQPTREAVVVDASAGLPSQPLS